MSQAAGRRALVYAHVNMNQIDGSSIWAQSVLQVLALAGCETTLVLRAPVHTDRLLAPLATLPGVRLVRPFEDGLVDGSLGETMSHAQASAVLTSLDAAGRFDLVVLRGFAVVRQVVKEGSFDGRIWSYLTDVPQSVTELDARSLGQLRAVVEASRLVLCQTEEFRAFFEATIPEACGKCVLFPPVVPPAEIRHVVAERDGPVRLSYSGKFAPRWKTEEMTRLPTALAERGVSAELHMIGDKIHQDPDDPDYRDRMEQALRGAPGVVWHGGRSRQEAMALTAGCDIGMSWRDRTLDASLELSTKVLEYGAVGLPVVLNRTPMHEALLGLDYPLFAGSEGEVLDAIESVTAEPELYALSAARCEAAAERFSLDRAVVLMRGHLERVFPSGPVLRGRPRRLRVGVASHDFKFFSRLLEHLEAIPELEVRVDRWPAIGEHDETESQALVDWAEVLICEWFGPNAVWYSRHKKRGQRLIVRLHRFELYRAWPARAQIEAIDQVVCVSPHYARLTAEKTGWPEGRIAVVPNWVDEAQLDRPKLDGARFHLGMIGVGEARKRFDIGLDVLERLRRRDDRFMLFAKTKLTWDYPWIWTRPGEQEHLDEVLRRIQTSPLLRGAAVFDRFGPDVATWLRKIGFVLSTSDDESFHLAPAEGMASGAVPLLVDWPGADTIYDRRWIHGGADEMAEEILALIESGRWEDEGRVAREQAAASFSLEQVCDTWTRLLTEDLPAEWQSTPGAAPAGVVGG